jgi:flagellar hook-length control protein FliK
VFAGKSATTPQSAAAAPSNPPAANVAAATRPMPLRKVPGAGDQGDDRTPSATAGASNGADAGTAVIALTLPLLVQLQQTPTIVPPAADGATPAVATLPAGLTNRLPLPAPSPTAAGNAAPLATPATSALATSIPLAAAASSLPAPTAAPATQAPALTSLAQGAAGILPTATGTSSAPGANPSASATVAAPVTTSTDAQSGNPAPLTSTINARLASGAAVLVSQPRVALASLAPANDKTAAKPASSDGGLPTNSRQLAAQSAHDASDTPVAPTTHTSEQPLTPTKDNLASALAAQTAHEPAAHEPAVAPPDNGALDTPSPPPAVPVAQSSPPPNEAPATLPIIPHAVAEQVAINLHQAIKSGTDHIQIQLQPADLGTIDVKLNVNHDGRVTVVVSADRSDTLNLLQQDASGLTQALRDAGLQADNSSLSFNLRGGFQFQQQQSAGSGGAARDGAYPSDGDGSDVIAAPLPSFRRHAGALDIHV